MKRIFKRKIKFSKRTKTIIALSLILLFPLLITTVSLSPIMTTEGSLYLLSGDVIKNFEFDKFDGDTIPASNMMYDNKLCFETQNIWRLEKDDIVKVLAYNTGNTTYLYYKVFMTNAINIFSNVRLNQMSEKAEQVEKTFLAGSYEHQGIFGDHMFSWSSDITWNHWDFGDIWNYNYINNLFQGSLEMSFDIAPSPLPDIFGEYAYKQFDYIAVSSASVTDATHGLMSEDIPEILTVIPEVYREEYSEESGGDISGNVEGGFEYIWDPDIDLDNMGVTQSFDAGMSYQESGSMSPKNKDGTPIWDPKDTGASMTDCRISYGVYSMSPVVMEYGGRLSWMEQNIVTKDKIQLLPPAIVVELKSYHEETQTEFGQIALHGWNRYLQSEMVVCFNIWTAVEIEALTEEYEYLKLHYPQEYYDLLIWSSLVGGFGGGRQYTTDPINPLGDLFDFFGGIFNFIIIVIIVGVGLYVFVVVGVPLLKAKALKDKLRRGNY